MHCVLIVDDDVINIKLIGNAFRQSCKTLFATNGSDALKMAKVNKPTVILLDVVMPGMNGFEVCEKLKSDPLTEQIPVFFVSAETSDKDIRHGLELGAIDYICKPFHPDDLKARVMKHLN